LASKFCQIFEQQENLAVTMSVIETVKSYDVLVIGAGCAGAEAALAASRLGCQVGIINSSWDNVAKPAANWSFSYNSDEQQLKDFINTHGSKLELAIKEALVGKFQISGTNSKENRLYLTLFNSSTFGLYYKHLLENNSSITPHQDVAISINVASDWFIVSTAFGLKLRAKAAILSVGRYLNAKFHCGDLVVDGGEPGLPSSATLASSLREEMGLKFFENWSIIPPRVKLSSVYSEKFTTPTKIVSKEAQGDPVLCLCAPLTKFKKFNQQKIELDIPALNFPKIPGNSMFYLLSTNTELDEATLIGLPVVGSTVQQENVIHLLPGLEKAKVVRPGYAVAYDCFKPDQLHSTLECKQVPKLFLAGQVNGASNYQQSAMQGLIAGINVALKLKEEENYLNGYLKLTNFNVGSLNLGDVPHET
jgi:tRNA uridine 5-carboxymethylaminomethyl modification enzyme